MLQKTCKHFWTDYEYKWSLYVNVKYYSKILDFRCIRIRSLQKTRFPIFLSSMPNIIIDYPSRIWIFIIAYTSSEVPNFISITHVYYFFLISLSHTYTSFNVFLNVCFIRLSFIACETTISVEQTLQNRQLSCDFHYS